MYLANQMQFNLTNRILFEDDYILAIDKPAGLMVEPDRNQNPSLLQYVKEYLKETTNNQLPTHNTFTGSIVP